MSTLKTFYKLEHDKRRESLSDPAETNRIKIRSEISPEQLPGKFIPMIIHDIRSPLASIHIANQVLRDTAADGVQEKDFREMLSGIISSNVEKIEDMIRELLEIKSHEGISYGPVRLCDVIDAVLEKAKNGIINKKIQVRKSYGGELLIAGNGERLVIAFHEILDRALAAIKTDNGQLWITVYQTNAEIKVILKIEGKGMQPENIDQIFNTDAPGVPGLPAMTPAKEILLWHHASITVNSEPDEGTSFIIGFKALY
jgi:signal transduction histidine kinase